MQNHKDLVLCSTLFLFPPNHPKEKYRYFSLSVDKRKQMTRLFRISGIPRYFHGMNFFSVNIFPIGSGKRRGSPILLPDSILLLHSLGPFPVRLCDVDSYSPWTICCYCASIVSFILCFTVNSSSFPRFIVTVPLSLYTNGYLFVSVGAHHSVPNCQPLHFICLLRTRIVCRPGSAALGFPVSQSQFPCFGTQRGICLSMSEHTSLFPTGILCNILSRYPYSMYQERHQDLAVPGINTAQMESFGEARWIWFREDVVPDWYISVPSVCNHSQSRDTSSCQFP